MNKLGYYTGIERGNDFLIIGAGASLRNNAEVITRFVNEKNLRTIGINKMTEFIVPNYHLWTNNQRLRDQADCIHPFSTLMIGSGVRPELRKKLNKNFIDIFYTKDPHETYKFEDGVIFGKFRIAGILAIAIADVLGAKNIYVVGFDGFCLHPENHLRSKKEDHHCYGSGYTDDATYEQCLVKDQLTRDGLKLLRDSGVNFKIITKTAHTEFFEDVMGIYDV